MLKFFDFLAWILMSLGYMFLWQASWKIAVGVALVSLGSYVRWIVLPKATDEEI